MSRDTTHGGGSGGGCVGAIAGCVLSVALNHSVGWAILHFILGWAYVLYVLLFRHREVLPALRSYFS